MDIRITTQKTVYRDCGYAYIGVAYAFFICSLMIFLKAISKVLLFALAIVGKSAAVVQLRKAAIMK